MNKIHLDLILPSFTSFQHLFIYYFGLPNVYSDCSDNVLSFVSLINLFCFQSSSALCIMRCFFSSKEVNTGNELLKIKCTCWFVNPTRTVP